MRRSIPNQIPLSIDNWRDNLHRAGFSCETPAAHTYDANGYQRWCIDCGAELGTPRQRHSNWWYFWSTIMWTALAGAVFVLIVMFVFASGTPHDPSVVPSTYGPPSVVHSKP